MVENNAISTEKWSLQGQNSFLDRSFLTLIIFQRISRLYVDASHLGIV